MSKKHSVKKNEQTKDKSPRVYQREKIGFDLNIRFPYEITAKQQQLVDLILNRESKIIFVNGPAGSAKTIISVFAGLRLLNDKKVSDIVFVRSVIESASKSLGALPGLASEKFEPYTMPLQDKLNEILSGKDIELLGKDHRIEYTPINFLRGASYNVKYILADEAQNLDNKELLTLITRLGRFSKMVICGDPSQSDIGAKSGFLKFFDLFNDQTSRENGIYCFSFSKEDIVRNGLIKYIMERVEGQLIRTESMFPKS